MLIGGQWEKIIKKTHERSQIGISLITHKVNRTKHSLCFKEKINNFSVFFVL